MIAALVSRGISGFARVKMILSARALDNFFIFCHFKPFCGCFVRFLL
jgi:hypothetical protein